MDNIRNIRTVDLTESEIFGLCDLMRSADDVNEAIVIEEHPRVIRDVLLNVLIPSQRPYELGESVHVEGNGIDILFIPKAKCANVASPIMEV